MQDAELQCIARGAKHALLNSFDHKQTMLMPLASRFFTLSAAHYALMGSCMQK